jgi:hypothetical protein
MTVTMHSDVWRTTHTVKIFMQVFRIVFPDKIISCFVVTILLPWLLDVAVPDCFLWSYIKNEVYRTVSERSVIYDSEFRSVFKGSPKKCYNILSVATAGVY